MAVLAIAYHNLGVEQEFLKLVWISILYSYQFHESLESYRQAREFAEKFLGPQDAITINLSSIYEKARGEIDSKFEMTVNRVKRRER